MVYEDREAAIFDLQYDKQYAIPLKEKKVKDVRSNTHKNFFVVIYEDGEAFIDILENNVRHSFQLQEKATTLCSFVDDRFLVVDYADKTVEVFDVNDKCKKYSTQQQENVLTVDIKENKFFAVRCSSLVFHVIFNRNTNEIYTFDVYGPKRTISLQQKKIEAVLYKYGFFIVQYEAHEYDVLQIAGAWIDRHNIPLKRKKIARWCIQSYDCPFFEFLKNSFFIAVYEDNEANIFTLDDYHQNYILQLKPKIHSIQIKNNRFVIVQYDDKKAEIFDLRDNNKRYCISLQQHTIAGWDIKDLNSVVVTYDGGHRETFSLL